ncbi:unnamed protein product [Coregonus sp. 'balchen']|nr:unnamed protein product [Coregonus sp. 'balchen']
MKDGNVPELDSLAKKLSFHPHVDIAFPCGQESVLIEGRLSCFLPLPNNDSNKTGLPVHVNACFGLTDNRRHIKWQEEDQKYDEAAMWNELLVKEVLPHTYLLMLQDATNLAKTSTLPVSAVYNIWPDLSQTKHKWHGIAEDILQRLFRQNTAVFSLAEDERQFVSPAEAVCPSNNTKVSEIMAAVTRTLIAGGEKLVTFPYHVSRAVQLAFPEPDTLKWVTPALVRDVLRRVTVSNLSNDDKRSLLQFILSDENYHNLRGLKMLPLSDGTFNTFTNEEKDIALIDNDSFPRVLLPGCKALFLPDDLSTTSIHHLRQLAATNTFKVFNVDADIVATFAKKTLPKDWEQTGGHVTWEVGSGHHPPLRWLREFWQCLNTHWGDLRCFEGMPLIPIEPLHDNSHYVILARLQQNPTIIFRKSKQTILPDKIEKVIKKVGGTVVNRDECLKHQDLDSYILPPSAQNILQVFMNLAASQVIIGIRSAPHHEKEELKDYLSTLNSLKVQERDLLSKMPLFQSMAGEYVSAQSKQAVVLSSTPALPTELPMPDSIVRCATEADRRLLLLLNVDLLDTAQAAIYLIDGVERKSFKKQETERIMTWILQHGSILFSQNGTLYTKCKDLSFIEVDEGELKKTSSIFDPNNKTFQVLFERDFFPPAVFTQTPEMLDSLARIGLQTKEMEVSADNVLHIATHIEKSRVHPQRAFKKAEALRRLLNDNDLLSQFSHQQLQHLSQLQWVPCENPCITKEKNKGKSLYKPEEIRHSEYKGIVGHVMPLTGDFSQKVSSKLGLLRLPPAEKVMENMSSLAAVAQAMTDPDKDVQFKTKLHSIYKYMQDHIPEVREVTNKRCIPWLWIHNHFVFPHDVVLAYPPDLDLSSYIERVTDEFLPYNTLLTEFGVKTSLSDKEIEDILHDIKQTIEERSQPFGEPSELKVSIAILNWMWREKKTVRVNIPVPVMAGSQRFTLQPLSKTVFCDISRNSLEDIQHDQEEIHVIHVEIPPATAEWLNIPFLSTRILRPELIGIEQCGQSEPITLRIKNILKEYDEDNDIFKELIQNAEDAGANTCKFMVDFRDHKDPVDSLIDQGMSLCQGPCLWAFNNELFSEDDWKNIVKLGSASKENEVEKIGKFGLGFNAVYHVTDIPSILSGKGLLILDPNVTHLQKHIQNKANAGIKLDLSREQLLHRFPGQFRPYERIFDCNLSKESTQKFYQGTLIKLPFRTREEAVKSEISGNVYDRDDIVKFQQELINSQTHLLFLKNIKTVSLQNLPSDASTPPQDDQIETLFTATRKVVSTIKIPEDTPPGTMQNDALKSLTKHYAKCQEVIDCHSANIAELTQQHCDGSDVQFWLLYNCFGTQNSLQMVQTDNKQTVFSLPIGGVAVPLNKEPQTGKWVPGEAKLVGQAFSFLPLSVATGLPVNLNGSFAVTSNRRGLWESGVKYDWNRALLQDAVTTAYVTTLLVLKNMSKNGDLQRYQYYTFWPNGENVSKTFKPLVDEFYFAIAQHFSGKALELFSDGDNWCSMCNARFLHPTIQEDKAVGELAMKVCQSNPNTSYHVVPLPSWVRQSFIQTGFDKILKQRTFDWEAFYQEVVFNNLSTMDQKSRNALVLHAIDLNDDAIDNLLRSYPCIPTKKGGQLQFIKKLVNPPGKVAHLFEQEEGRFLGGTKNDFCSPKRIQRLSELGMLSDQLPLEDITERAETIASIWQKDKGKAYKHLQCILELMRDSLQDEASPHWETLRNTEFIPACAPVNTWEGKDDRAGKDEAVRLQKPTDIYSDRCRHLVDMTQSVVDSSNLKIHSDDAVLRILGLCESPSLETVLQQLQEASKHTETFDKQMLFNIAYECYKFLNEWLHDEKDSTAIFEGAHSFPFILVEDRFVDVKSVAKNEKFEAKPYLHVLPPALSKFKELWKCLGIQKKFTPEQFHCVLQKLSQAYGISPLSNNDLEICLIIILRGLYKAKDENQNDGLIPDENQDDCLIPDGSGVLQPSNQLYFNDSPWMEVSEDVTLCHKKISRPIALYFGVITTRHHTLQKHSVENFSPFAEEFGQHEELTVRIKNIIAAYPAKKDILKELIQNADDAEATEIHFVWDKRKHSTERTFGQRWHPLQGPALCVYNNQVFSDADLRGIQQLGQGGKHNIPGKTGKYGLGFNSVYHLTDCPSILTGDKWLCISDPNLKYAEFFKKIGVKDEPTAEQYCNVLQEIHADSTDKQTLQPNLEETVKRAVEQLFCLIRKLKENQLTSELPKALYLPSTDGRLYPSDSLYFNDTVFQVSRLEGALKDKLKLLEKLSNCHLGFDMYEHHKMLQLLPLEIRPKMLSQITVENVVESNMQLCEYGEGCEFSGWFQAHLSSAPFRHGLVCLIRQQKEGQVSQGDAATMCEKAFGSIEITCCKSLETVLWLGKELLSGTTAATQLYVKKGQQGCTFYLKHNNDTAHKVKSEVIMRLTNEINVLLKNILGSNLLLVLGHLLSCDSMEDVKMALEQSGIHYSADTGSTDTKESLKGPPEPGSSVPEEWHDALDMSYLNNYEAGEYVAYKKTAEEEHWCYAVVVEQLYVPTGQSGQSAHRYKIQMGKDKVIEVGALDLYQFKREKKPSSTSTGATCMELVQLAESVPRSSTTRALPQSLEEAKKDIEKCLAEIWTLSAEERHKAIKRLWLRWHPDKNLDFLQLATEAFKYLQNRIEDLENSRTGNQSSPQWNTHFRNFYEQWNQEAHHHRCGRERFYRTRGHNTRYNFYTYHENVPQPNRAEAQRWLSQAQCDLAAAHNDTGGRATEWTLFKVHQAVEKALIAAEYRRHGQHSSNSSISILAERVSGYSPKLDTLPSIVSKLKQLGVDAKTTQYPNYHHLPHIPNKMFKCENETEVLDMASKLLCKIEMYIN